MYAVFFDFEGITYRLPTNPEEIEVSSSQAIEKYEILSLGQIAFPTHMDLKEYSFECEFPHSYLSYVEVKGPDEFKDADFYIKNFESWRTSLTPIRFMAGKVNDSGTKIDNDGIDTFVLIEDLTIKERAGEEGDKYISFKLIEYKKYGALEAPDEIDEKTGKKKKPKSNKQNPKKNSTYIVQVGDSLWSIAKRFYGDGSKYPKLVSSNKDKIKNPSLIYPGQKLVIP